MFMGPLASTRGVWEPLLAVVAIASMTVGNLAAITQSNVKRLLAYSSISHAGYMLLGPIAAMVTVCEKLGAKTADLLRYATSGEVTGDRREVVGYAAIAVM
jgi:NADH-quinone oxidoreductase subunit N